MVNPWQDENGYGYRNPEDNPDPGGDDGTGRDLAQQRADCQASGGRWIPNGPYGQGTCTHDTPETGPRPDGCPDGQEKSPFDANGGDASYPLECVSHEEAQRRFDLRKGKNQSESSNNSSSSSSTYKAPTYTPTKSPYADATSKAIYDNLIDMMNGGKAPYGPETIAKLQAAALQSNKSQLGNSRVEMQKRLINSGLSRSGVAPASYQKLESAAGADFSNNMRTIATTAVQKNYEAKVTALNQAQQFLQSERANSLSQDQLILSYARLKQEMATLQMGYDQQWKVIQNGNEQEMMKLMLCLRTGVC